MILVNLKGRIGNAMFEIATGKYIADKLGTELYVKKCPYCSFYDYYDKIFSHEFFQKLNVLPINYDTSSMKEISHKNINFLDDVPIEDNLFLNGWFLTPHCFTDDTIKDLYVPSDGLKEELFDLYSPTRNSLMINIRRGDFLWDEYQSQGYHSEPKEYWKAVYEYLNKKYDKVFVTSDDIEWCKENLDFCNNLVFVDKQTEHPKIFVDLFLPSFVGDNAISCSTFSWWTAHLNKNPDKIVVKPFPWNTGKWLYDNEKYYVDTDVKFDIFNLKEKKDE